MTVAVCLILLVLICASYNLSRRGSKITRQTLLSMRMPAERFRFITRDVESTSNLIFNTSLPVVHLKDIRFTYQNSRILVRAADQARCTESERHEAFAMLHADLAESHRQTVGLLLRALVERAFEVFPGPTRGNYYGCAAIWSYGREALIVTMILELCRDPNADIVEGHI